VIALGWRSLPAVARRLMVARAARSLGQGALVAAFALYLQALGWSASAIGATLSGALLAGAILTLLVGPLSDRAGRRRFLLWYEAAQAVAALVALATAWPPALVVAAVVGGFGRGANGSAGPFAPLEQAWLAQVLPVPQRGAAFGANAAIGFSGMALGALLAGGVALFQGALGAALGYRPIFALSLAGSLGAFALIAGARETTRARPNGQPAEIVHEDPAHRQENRMLVRLVVANTLNGLGIGMIAPLIAYWFALRFQHGPGSIGPALAGSFVLAALGSVVAARLVNRHGLSGPVVIMRATGLALLVTIPLVPAFVPAAALYALRAGFNQGTAGVRQALVVGLTRDSRRGLAASLHNVSIQIPRAFGPLVAGVMLHAGMLTTPFLLAALFQAAYLVLYVRFFRGYAAGGID
jgi:MFS family permease